MKPSLLLALLVFFIIQNGKGGTPQPRLVFVGSSIRLQQLSINLEGLLTILL